MEPFKVGDRVEWVDGMHAGPGVIEDVIAEGEYLVREDDQEKGNLQRRRDLWIQREGTRAAGATFEETTGARSDDIGAVS